MTGRPAADRYGRQMAADADLSPVAGPAVPGSAQPSPAEVASALRRAGLADVSHSALRRALYSSDASLYRVVPAVVACPRDAAEVAAALTACAQLGVPVTSRGAGHVDRGQCDRDRGGPRFPAAPEPDHQPGPRRGHRHRPARRRAGRAAAGRRPARPALRPGPVHPRSLHHRRHDREQLLRLTVTAVRPDSRERAGAGRPDRYRHAAAPGRRRPQRAAGGRGRASWHPRSAAGRAARDRGGRAEHDPDRVRPLRPPGFRLRPGAPASRARLRRPPGPGGQRGHPGHHHRRDRAPGPGSPAPGPGRAGLPGYGQRGRRGPGDPAAAAGDLRGNGLAAGGRGAPPAR